MIIDLKSSSLKLQKIIFICWSRFRQNIQLLEDDITVGAIGAGKYLFSTLENNEEHNYNLPEWRAKFNINGGTNYFGGTMFLARAYPLERLKLFRLVFNLF